MPNNNDNEIIKEQRKAREEFLKLKKMQHGELEPEPKPSEIAVVPTTFWQKIKNIWYHDKMIIIVALLFFVAFSIMFVQCAAQPKYDMKIVLFTYDYVLDDNTEKMEEYFEKYCSDVNGDGKIKVQVINCSFDDENDSPSYKNNKKTRLEQTIVSEYKAMLYILDENSLEHFDKYEGKFLEKTSTELGDDFYNAAGLDSDDFKLKLYSRQIEDTTVDAFKDAPLYKKEAHDILSTISKEK